MRPPVTASITSPLVAGRRRQRSRTAFSTLPHAIYDALPPPFLKIPPRRPLAVLSCPDHSRTRLSRPPSLQRRRKPNPHSAPG